MSQENVEIMRRVNEALDAKDMEALLAAHHPNVEIVVLRSEIEGPYRGHEGLRRMATEALEADWKIRIDEIRDCGSRVLVLGRQGTPDEPPDRPPPNPPWNNPP
jgi:ketosteroid isomerase-like protein